MTEQLIDNKYIPLKDEFNQKGYHLKKVHEFESGWLIYERTNPNNKYFKRFELIKPSRNEQYVMAGVTIPPKISYPSEKKFGSTGFDFGNLQSAINKHSEIIKEKQRKEEKRNE